MADKTVFEQYQVGQWRAAYSESPIAFPVISIEEDGGNRLIKRERAYRNGVKIDDTGAREIVWNLDVDFSNSIEEDGLEAVNGAGVAIYPDVLNNLLDSFARYHELPGDLYIPTRGWVRARLDTYRRRETPDKLDCASVTFSFVEDNEDRVDARAFQLPSVQASAERLAQTTEFDQQSDGIWNDDSQSLGEFTTNLESWANAPDDSAQEVDRVSSQTVGSVNRVFKAFSKPGVSGRDTLRDPESSQTARKLHATKAIASRAAADSRRGRPAIESVVFERVQSLVSVAVLVGQSFEDLLALNPQIDDPLRIPPKTPVRIYGEQAA